MKELLIRIGTFFIMIGVGLFILFVASDYSQVTNFDYLFWAVFAITVGILLRRKKPTPPPSGRFAWWRKMRGQSKGNEAERHEGGGGGEE